MVGWILGWTLMTIEYKELNFVGDDFTHMVPTWVGIDMRCSHESIEQRCEYIVCSNCGHSLSEKEIELAATRWAEYRAG